MYFYLVFPKKENVGTSMALRVAGRIIAHNILELSTPPVIYGSAISPLYLAKYVLELVGYDVNIKTLNDNRISYEHRMSL